MRQPSGVTMKEGTPMFKPNRSIAKDDIHKLDLASRVTIEAQITDARAETLDRERFTHMETNFEQWIATIPWRRYLFTFLGPLDGKIVLDIGCGYAMTPVIFALAGATVYAVDVAPKTLAINL